MEHNGFWQDNEAAGKREKLESIVARGVSMCLSHQTNIIESLLIDWILPFYSQGLGVWRFNDRVPTHARRRLL